MSSEIRGLYVGSSDMDIEPHERAFRAIGAEVDRVEDADLGAIIEAVKDADVLISEGHKLDAQLFDHMGVNGRCQGMVSFGHGFDGIDVAAASENGVVLSNTASFGTEEVSNHTMMLFLVASRKFALHHKLMINGQWTREYLPPMGHISGQTFGIVGLGNIGRAVARKAKAFGLNVVAHDPMIPSWDIKEYGVEPLLSVDEVCRVSDYVSPHVFLNDSTYHMFSDRQFEVMKSTAYMINCSRGPVVDEAALIRALQSGQIAGAALDVFEQEPPDPDNPLFKMDNVAVTNHYASFSELAWDRAQSQLGEEAVRIATGSWPMSHINPDVRHKISPRSTALQWEVYLQQLQAGA